MRTLVFAILLASLPTLFHSCKKVGEGDGLEIMELPVQQSARCFAVRGDSLIVAGGDAGGHGFIAMLRAGEQGFQSVTDDLPREIYSLTRHHGRWFAGSDSVYMYVSDSLHSHTNYWWDSADWVSDLSKHPIRQMVQDQHGLLAVAGGKLAFGVLYHSYDTARSWTPLEPENEIRCAAISGKRAWIGGNGILMRTEWGSGDWERLPLESTFITSLIFENEGQGIALTQQGHVLSSDDGGMNWSTVYKGNAGFMHRMARQGNTIVAVGEEGRLFYSTDGGEHWKSRTMEGKPALYDVVFFNGQCYIAAGNGTVIIVDPATLK